MYVLVAYRMKKHWINFIPLSRKDTRTDMEILFKLPKFLIHQDRHSQIWLMLNWKITRYHLCLSFRSLKMENGLFTEMVRMIVMMNCKRKVLSFKVRIRNCHILKALNNKVVIFFIVDSKVWLFCYESKPLLKKQCWTSLHRRQTLSSGLVRQWNSPEILVLGHHLCTRIWVHTMIGLLKMTLLICQSGWREIWNAFSVICWACWWPRARMSAGSWKTWKIMEFKTFILQAWKVVELSLKVMEN